MDKKKLIIIVVAAVLSIIFFNLLINIRINLDQEKSGQIIRSKKISETKTPLKISKTKRKLTPENPKKYGIIVNTEVDQPRNQAQWNLFMEKALVQSKVLEQEGAQEALDLMKKSPEDFQARLNEIDVKIKTSEETKFNNPSDKDAEDRLQVLYQLKSLMKVLKSKVISTSPVSPQIPSTSPQTTQTETSPQATPAIQETESSTAESQAQSPPAASPELKIP